MNIFFMLVRRKQLRRFYQRWVYILLFIIIDLSYLLFIESHSVDIFLIRTLYVSVGLGFDVGFPDGIYQELLASLYSNFVCPEWVIAHYSCSALTVVCS